MNIEGLRFECKVHDQRVMTGVKYLAKRIWYLPEMTRSKTVYESLCDKAEVA